MSSRWLGLSVLAAALALALVSPPGVAAVTLVLPLLATILGPRLALDRLAQAVVTVAAMVGGVLSARLLATAPTGAEIAVLSDRALLFALPILGIAGVRALMVAPHFGAPLTVAATLVTLTAAGRARSGLAYPLLAAACLSFAFLALARADSGRARPGRVPLRYWLVTLLALATAGSLTWTASVTLPPLQAAAAANLLQRFRARTGFSDRVALGSLAGLLESDRVVLRIRGDRPPSLLRGAVLSEYSAGTWEALRRLPVPEVVEVATTAPELPGVLEIENARRPERYFLPLDAHEVAAATGFFTRDLLGIHRPVRRFEAKRIWFLTGGARPVYAPAEPDRAVPRALLADLSPLLEVWGAATGSPAARVAAIEARLLADYRYSVEFARRPGHDPVVDFLLHDRHGHCEYFASSLALLARLAGVPTRVVTGYRVAERSRWGYAVVRQRHAHAWVEAWLDERWVTVDPTPAAPLAASAPTETPAVSALLDRLATGWEAMDDWLARRSAFELAMALVTTLSAWILYRSLYARRRRALGATRGEPPLPGFIALGRALARHGVAREPSETVARFADRVETTAALGPTRSAEIAAMLRAYAEHRYAERGDPVTINAQLTQRARELRRRRVGTPLARAG